MPNFAGKDIIDIADQHLNELYILGARVPLANKHWKGPWDCAEFVSWCAYQAYDIIYAVRPPNPMTGESYSGWWYDDAHNVGVAIPVKQAIATAGAILVRKPHFSSDLQIGHVSISRGDGSTIEAKNRASGVCIGQNAVSRPWSIGVLIPGVKYGSANAALSKSYKEPAGLLFLTSPYMRGVKVKALQAALANAGLFPGEMDGVFGPLTAAAVQSFQAMEGLVADGIVGSETRDVLGI
jgi:N-acetylmuramoyl-L-alanine amidase